jgi:hypothetical protein
VAVVLPATEAPLETPLESPAGVSVALGSSPDAIVSTTDSQAYAGDGAAIDGVLTYPLVTDYAWFIYSEITPVLPARIRSSFEATLGRTLVGTPQADRSITETVPRGELTLGDAVLYPTILRPDEPIAILRAIEDQGGLPPYEQTIAYETRLAILSRLYPDSLYTTALDAIGIEQATAQEVLQYLFDRWAERFPDFRAKPVPPIVLFVPDADGLYTRTLTAERIEFKQTRDRKRSIAQLLEDFRQAFPGYGVDVDSDDDIVIRPPPWAVDFDATAVAPAAVWYGPSEGFSPTDEDFRTADRLDVTSSSELEIEAEYDGSSLVVRASILVLFYAPDAPNTGPQLASVTQILSLAPNEETRVAANVTARDVPTQRFTATTLVSYRLTWERPGPTGGTLRIEPRILETSGSSSFGTIYAAHALRLDASSESVLGAPGIGVLGPEIESPVPEPSFDGSRVINAQTARYAEIDFVEGDDLIPASFVRWGPTEYEPAGANLVGLGSIQSFVDEDGNPLPIGETVEVEWLYELRISASATEPVNEGPAQEGLFGGGDPVTRSGLFTLAPGATHTEDIVLNGEWALTYGRIVTIRWTRVERPDGTQGIAVTYANISTRTTNVTVARPWLGHVTSWTTTGEVWRETGVVLDATYDETDDEDAGLSQSLFGRREGPLIVVNFFPVRIEQLLEICEGIVRFHHRPRARYRGLRLTPESEITPDDLNRLLYLPNDLGGVLEAYRYADASAVRSYTATRELDLEVITSLTSDAGTPASDVEEAVEATASISGASHALDADE